MSVFISYSTKDSDFIQRLSQKLVDNGINVWLDKWEMQVGDSLIDKIQNGIKKSSFLLVVLSKNSIQSEWCRKELNSGLIRELKKKQTVILPILIEDCEIPPFLEEKLYADFRIDFDLGFDALIKPLSKLFSENMGRNTTNDVVTDYAINWGVNEDNLYELKVDMVSWLVSENKSLIVQLIIFGCDNATQRFLKDFNSGRGWLMKGSIFAMMYMNEDINELKMRVGNGIPFRHVIYTDDVKLDINFIVNVRAVLMGEDNGMDKLFQLGEYLSMLYESSSERIDKKR